MLVVNVQQIDSNTLVFLFNPVATFGDNAVKFSGRDGSKFARPIGKVFVYASLGEGYLSFGSVLDPIHILICARWLSHHPCIALSGHEFADPALFVGLPKVSSLLKCHRIERLPAHFRKLPYALELRLCFNRISAVLVVAVPFPTWGAAPCTV